MIAPRFAAQRSTATKSVPLALPVLLLDDQKTIITIFRWTALAEPLAHEKLAVKTSFNGATMRRKVENSRDAEPQTGHSSGSVAEEPILGVRITFHSENPICSNFPGVHWPLSARERPNGLLGAFGLGRT